MLPGHGWLLPMRRLWPALPRSAKRGARAVAGWRQAVPCLARAAATGAASAAGPVDGAGLGGQAGDGIGGRYFTKTHEWFQDEGSGVGTLGITHVAQRALGEVVFCRLPSEGERFRQMETIVTLEAVKTVGEVKSPVHGEVLEVNPRLQREPALVSYAPLSEGWLVRIAFNGRVPRYLRGSHTVARAEVEGFLAEPKALQAFLLERLGQPAAEEEESAEDAEGDQAGGRPKELTFSGLYSAERSCLHQAAEELGFTSKSHGLGPGRKLVVSRVLKSDEEGAAEASDGEERQGRRRRRGR